MDKTKSHLPKFQPILDSADYTNTSVKCKGEKSPSKYITKNQAESFQRDSLKIWWNCLYEKVLGQLLNKLNLSEVQIGWDQLRG